MSRTFLAIPVRALHVQQRRCRCVETTSTRLESKVAISSEENDVGDVLRNRSTIGRGVDDAQTTREVILLPCDGPQDHVVHIPRDVMGEPALERRADEIDVLRADGEVLEVVPARRLDLEVTSVDPDGLL